MSENQVSGILDITIDKMKAMADSDVIVGDKIMLPDGVVAVPVSKVSYGFASGGSDFACKAAPTQKLFGGGGGGGMTVSPVAFLVCKDGDVKLMPLSFNQGAADKAVSLVPELFDRVVALFTKEKHKQESPADPSVEV